MGSGHDLGRVNGCGQGVSLYILKLKDIFNKYIPSTNDQMLGASILSIYGNIWNYSAIYGLFISAPNMAHLNSDDNRWVISPESRYFRSSVPFFISSSCLTLLVWFSPSLANKYISCGCLTWKCGFKTMGPLGEPETCILVACLCCVLSRRGTCNRPPPPHPKKGG